ncbi:MAG: hypothetical protein HUJ29_08795 [Gammaproteobacteria bacterium]|nr:hypothetical protein [Gammaproteobacteria bacterium]
MRPILVILLGLMALQGHAAQYELINMAGQSGQASAYPRGFNTPHDLVLGPNGNKLYVADTDNDLIQVLNAQSLKPTGTIGRGLLDSPHDLAFGPNGRLYVADSHHDRILVFDVSKPLARHVGTVARDFASPEGIAFDVHGRMLVSNAGSNTILVLSHQRPVVLKRLGGYGQDPGQFRRPHDIETSIDGRIFIADPGNHRIQIFSPNLTYMTSLDTGRGYRLRDPKYLAIHRNGWLAVANEGRHQVLLFDAALNLIGQIGNGRPGRTRSQLNAPEGVAMHEQDLWIADSGNHRILHYRLTR